MSTRPIFATVLAALTLCAGLAALAAHGASAGAAHASSYSAVDLYNTANAYARQGKPGLAILNYERARLLAPGDADIEANLAFVRQTAGLPPEAHGRLDRALAVVAHVDPDFLAWTGLAGLILAGACLLTAGRQPRHRWKLRVAAVLGLLLIGVTVADAVALWPTLHAGIVLAPATPARVSPVPMGEPLFVLQEGESVRVAATHEGFVLVESHAGRMGWVAESNLSAVVPR